MKKALLSLLVLAFLLLGAAFAEDGASIQMIPQPGAGDREIVLAASDLTDRAESANVFAGDEPIAASVERLEDGALRLLLTRPLVEGEEITVVLGPDGEQVTRTFAVQPVHAAKLSALRARVDGMTPVLAEWIEAFRENRVIIPLLFEGLPFVTYPDEAPEITVREEDGRAAVYVSEALPDGWSLHLYEGVPAEERPCTWDGALGCYVTDASFDSVSLTSEGDAARFGITVSYERGTGFLPGYPIVEWYEADVNDPIACNCYGYGTPRGFNGGMWAIVGPSAAFYAEYGADRVLTDYWNLFTECCYDNQKTLLSGEEPADYVDPVEIR